MIVTNKTEYLLRIRDITSQFAYVDLMWNTLKSMMVMVQPSLLASGDKNIQPEQRLNVFLCAHSFNEWLRVLYMFYSTTVRYLREYEAGKATDIRSFLLVMLHRIDHSYRPEIARYMPVLQTVLASSFKSPSCSSSFSSSTATSTIHQKYNAGHATDIYDTIVMDADMLEIAFVEIRQLCHALYKDELKTDPTLEWQDVQVNLPVKSTHTRFESYTYV